MTEQLPAVIRPNGKTYRARRIRIEAWSNDHWDAEDRGVLVIGTHDVEVARARAEAYIDEGERVIDAGRTWVRLGYLYRGEQCWRVDEVRGAAAVSFTIEPGFT